VHRSPCCSPGKSLNEKPFGVFLLAGGKETGNKIAAGEKMPIIAAIFAVSGAASGL